MDGIKYDKGKLELSKLLALSDDMLSELCEVSDVVDYGARKYSSDNWKRLENGRRRYAAAACRHIRSLMNGEIIDSESGLTHAAHAITNVLFLLHHVRNLQNDNE